MPSHSRESYDPTFSCLWCWGEKPGGDLMGFTWVFARHGWWGRHLGERKGQQWRMAGR